jgi:hypothetical protein
MRIPDFLHVNNIVGQDLRPDWRSLSNFAASTDTIKTYMAQNKIEYLVLLEDFVGSGAQMTGPVRFAANLNSDQPVLVLPLIVCPKGAQEGINLEKEFPNIVFRPIFTLSSEMLIQPSSHSMEPEIHKLIRDICIRLKDQVQYKYGPFGFGDTGAIFVMYTNCPDNTLALIHHKSQDWKPLFPRSSRT